MRPCIPPVDAVYPAIGVDVNALEFPKFATLDPNRYKETKLKHFENTPDAMLVHDGKLNVVRFQQS